MNQEKFGQLIKKIRKENNLTQKEFADKYHVTYQAVSKWENGKNMPDTYLIKQISKDFNVSIESLLEGEFKESKPKNTKSYFYILLITLIVLITIMLFFLIFHKDDFKFKTISASCNNFNISGSISYNETKSAIYINNIEYCGPKEEEKYQKIECILYETNADIEKKISSFKYHEKEEITLEEFLKKVTFSVDNYTKTCKKYKKDSLSLAINATTKDDKIITYKVPLKLNTC